MKIDCVFPSLHCPLSHHGLHEKGIKAIEGPGLSRPEERTVKSRFKWLMKSSRHAVHSGTERPVAEHHLPREGFPSPYSWNQESNAKLPSEVGGGLQAFDRSYQVYTGEGTKRCGD